MPIPRLSVHETPIGWSIDVYIDDKMIHHEYSDKRPSFQYREQLKRLKGIATGTEATVVNEVRQ